jgi:hypothetical protein
MTTVTEQDIAAYAEAVRRALADLPAPVRDELLEDLPEHLAEVAAETDGSLGERLGPPEAYAAELRAAAGVRPTPASARTIDDKIADAFRVARARLSVADRRAGPVLGYERVSDFLTLLRPGWWVLRAYLLAMVLTVTTSGDHFLVPELGDNLILGFLVLLGLVVGSVWVGRREHRLGVWPRFVVAVSGVGLALFGLAAVADDGFRGGGPTYYETNYDNPLLNVQDVYVYDGQGRLIEGARIFDQNGQPIQMGSPYYCDPNAFVSEPLRYEYPFCPDLAPFRFAPGAEQSAPVATPAPTPVPTPAPTAEPSAGPTATPVATVGPTTTPVPPAPTAS